METNIKSYEWDMAYLRLLTDLQKYYNECRLVWDDSDDCWGLIIKEGLQINIVKKQMLYKFNLDEDRDYFDVFSRCIQIVKRYTE